MTKKTKSQLNNLIDEWILNERGRNILKRCMLDGITYEKAAEEFNLPVKQIKNICYKSLEIMAANCIK